jgi:hypothetical protein
VPLFVGFRIHKMTNLEIATKGVSPSSISNCPALRIAGQQPDLTNPCGGSDQGTCG